MYTYRIPTESNGPLWDKNGHQWEKYINEDDEIMWKGVDTANDEVTWTDLLFYYGPLADTPDRPKVGSLLTYDQLLTLTTGAIIAIDGEAPYTNEKGWWCANGQKRLRADDLSNPLKRKLEYRLLRQGY